MDSNLTRIGLTTTIPVEVIFASGKVPVDLNNTFITSPRPRDLVTNAEVNGYPRNICNWIKGIYSSAIEQGINRVVGVVRGDCSNTEGLLDTLDIQGVEVFPFSYPYGGEYSLLRQEIERFATWLGTDMDAVREILPEIEDARKLSWEIDRRTWQDNTISGGENHLYLVSTSDFLSDLALYKRRARILLEDAEGRDTFDGIRVGYIGVPPIITNLYDVLEEIGFHVVYNEVQHQFSMPYPDEPWDRRYLSYTYPYSIKKRIEYIKKEIKKRKIKGIIHYVQSFCHRQIDDIIIREAIDLPVLTLEYDLPGELDERTRIRLESFKDILE